jgi:hypothetical protein
MSVNDTLRERVQSFIKLEGTRYRVAKDAKVNWGSLQKFLEGGSLRAEQFDRLCEFFNLELRPSDKPVKTSRKKA